MEYRVVTNSDVWRVQRRRGPWWPWFSLKHHTWGDLEITDFANKDSACAAMREWRREDEAATQIRRHGWQARKCN